MAMLAGDQPIDVTRFSPFYDAELSYLDVVLGELFSWLRAQGYYEKALILITSDHGEHLGEDGRFSHQFSVEEELLSIPLVIKYPQNSGSGRVVENPLVSNLDVYETILGAAAGGKRPSNEAASGSQNLGDMRAFERRHLIAEYYYFELYLRSAQALHEGFDVEAYRVKRRVVYDDRGRYAFEQRNGASKAVSARGKTTARRQAEALEFLHRYERRLQPPEPPGPQQPPDPRALERLRSLGYID